MTTRIEPDLDNTEKLLEQILTVILAEDSRVAFLVPAGASYHVMARVRTMISRKRKQLQLKGKRPKRFMLNSTIHSETHHGKRYDCIVCWKHVNESHILTETLEDLMANG